MGLGRSEIWRMVVRRISIPWGELGDQSYQGGKDFLKQIGQQAKGVACSLYRNTPGALVPNPISNFLTGMWDSICSDDPGGLPPFPSPPFEGGQCNTNYKLDYGYAYSAGSEPVPQFDSIGFPGGMIGWRIDLTRQSGGTESYGWNGHIGGTLYSAQRITAIYPDGVLPAGREYLVLNSRTYCYGLRTFNLRRIDGLPDDCGAPPPEFPPPPPNYQPPSGDIVVLPRPDTPDFSITIPFVWVDADFGLNISPYIDVGGIKVTFDLGGLNFDFDVDAPLPNYDPDVLPAPDIPFPPSPLPPDGWGDLVVNIDNTNSVVNNIDVELDDKADKTDIPDYQDELDRIEDKIDQLPPPPDPFVPCLVGEKPFVRVQADISNYTGKSVFTDDNDDPIIFGGYIRFLIGNEPYGEELPIRRLLQNFEMPSYADGYRLVPQNNITLTSSLIKPVVNFDIVGIIDCSDEGN